MSGSKIYRNYIYYRRYRNRRLQYFHLHHKQWKKLKRFAKKLCISLPEARSYIDQKLREWYIQEGYLERLEKRPYGRRGRVLTVPAERQPPPLDKGDQSLD